MPIASEFFQPEVEILQDMILVFRQQRSCHFKGELIESNTYTGNVYEPVISSIYSTSTRRIPFTSLQLHRYVHHPEGWQNLEQNCNGLWAEVLKYHENGSVGRCRFCEVSF